MESITKFEGKNRFLSNFYPHKINIQNPFFIDSYHLLVADSNEHAYQAYKASTEVEFLFVLKANTPGLAKKRGRQVEMRKDWDNVKLAIMTDLVRLKFSDNTLKSMLLDTGNAELVEGNYWNDTYWGVCKGVGYNHLGKILMEVREELQC